MDKSASSGPSRHDELEETNQDLRLGTETWELYKDLIHLWTIYTTHCPGTDSDGLRFVLRQARLLQELSDYPTEIVNRVARQLGRTHRHFGVIQWLRSVRSDVARIARFRGGDAALPTRVLINVWKADPPPFWRAARRLAIAPDRSRQAFDEMMELASFIDAHYSDVGDGLVYAADRVVASYLAWVDEAADLLEKLDRASADVENRLSAGPLGRQTLEQLDKIRVLIPDQSPHGRSTLARRLREIRRPDLAVDVTAHFDASNPGHQYAAIARAAAHTDLADLDAAYADAAAVWNTTTSPAAAVMLSKISRIQREDADNLEWAFEAWDLRRDQYTAQNLITASLVRPPAGRQADIDAAELLLQEPISRNQLQRREEYVTIRAARILLSEGRVEEAERAAEAVLAIHHEYFPAKQLLVEIRIAGGTSMRR